MILAVLMLRRVEPALSEVAQGTQRVAGRHACQLDLDKAHAAANVYFGQNRLFRVSVFDAIVAQ